MKGRKTTNEKARATKQKDRKNKLRTERTKEKDAKSKHRATAMNLSLCYCLFVFNSLNPMPEKHMLNTDKLQHLITCVLSTQRKL